MILSVSASGRDISARPPAPEDRSGRGHGEGYSRSSLFPVFDGQGDVIGGEPRAYEFHRFSALVDIDGFADQHRPGARQFEQAGIAGREDRKSTRLNSSH